MRGISRSQISLVETEPIDITETVLEIMLGNAKQAVITQNVKVMDKQPFTFNRCQIYRKGSIHAQDDCAIIFNITSYNCN